MATHIFHKLVNSARLFMKKASWGCCVLVFDSSGEPVGHPDFSDSFAPGCSGTEFEDGRTSCEDGLGATVHAPMDYESSRYCSTCCIRGDLGQSHICFVSGPVEVPTVQLGKGDISTEAETRRQEIKECQNLASFDASGAKCVSINRLFGSGPQSGTAGAGFRRW